MKTSLLNKLTLAKDYKQQRKYDLAVKELAGIVSFQPQNAEAHLLLGITTCALELAKASSINYLGMQLR